MGTVANRTLPSLHGRSLEITFTVPLIPVILSDTPRLERQENNNNN